MRIKTHLDNSLYLSFMWSFFYSTESQDTKNEVLSISAITAVRFVVLQSLSSQELQLVY